MHTSTVPLLFIARDLFLTINFRCTVIVSVSKTHQHSVQWYWSFIILAICFNQNQLYSFNRISSGRWFLINFKAQQHFHSDCICQCGTFLLNLPVRGIPKTVIQSFHDTCVPRDVWFSAPDDTKTFQINSKGHLQCLQDPKLIHRPNDKGKLPGSREAPIYHEPGTVSCKTVEDLKKLYPNSFDRLGSLKGAYNIRIDPSVKPATHARRKVPIESKEAIDRELDFLIEEEIITEQVEPTPWVSSVTFPRKPNGEVRVCLDPSNLNKAIIREHHKPMTVEEIAHELAGATVYTKADALKAFLQIHLTHEASLLTTFNSHRGRLRFLRMPFGAKMSQDVFQLRMDAILEQCPGVIGIHDDMVIFGVDQEDHDANLINLLNVCQKEGLVLNSKKLELRRERVTFFGAEYSAQGMHPDPKKVQGITEMTAPTDKQQLQSFLGMVNYMGTFIPNLSHHTEPLRAMLKKDNVFHWEDQQTRSFQQVNSCHKYEGPLPLLRDLVCHEDHFHSPFEDLPSGYFVCCSPVHLRIFLPWDRRHVYCN